MNCRDIGWVGVRGPLARKAGYSGPVEETSRLVAVRVRASGRVAAVRLAEAAAFAGASWLLWWLAGDASSSYRARLPAVLVWNAVVMAYLIGCAALESGLVPRAVVFSSPRRGSKWVLSWRSLAGGGVLAVHGESEPLTLGVEVRARMGWLRSSMRVNLTLHGVEYSRGAVRIVAVTTEPEQAVRRLQGELARAGIWTVPPKPPLSLGGQGAALNGRSKFRWPEG